MSKPFDQLLLITTTFFLLTSVYTPNAVAAPPPVCESFTPAVDGAADSQWLETPFYGFPNRVDLPGGGPTEVEPFFQVTWDAHNLFLYIDVLDAQLVDAGVLPEQGDSVDIFIDGGNEKNTTYDGNDHHFQVRLGDATIYHRSAGDINPANVSMQQIRTETGYQFEMALPWSLIGVAPRNQFLIGFDIYVNDDIDGNGADHRVTWSNVSGTNPVDPSGFGSLKIGRDFCEDFCFNLIANSQPVMLCL